jgi:hypothetical protein
LHALAAQLRFDAALLHQVVRQLHREGLASWTAGDTASLSDAGRRALEHGDYVRPQHERRTFHFWHADWPVPAAGPTSRFVAVVQPEKLPWLPAPEAPFDGELLRACINEPTAWKERNQFPQDVHRLLASQVGTPVSSWEQVLVDYPQRLFAAVVQTRAESGTATLVGVAAQTRNWELHAAQPAFVVPLEPKGWFPPPVAEDAWRRSFVAWCQQRQLAAEAEQCRVQPEGQRLLVTAPEAVVAHLRSGKSNSRAETWLLADEGTLRAAARLELG